MNKRKVNKKINRKANRILEDVLDECFLNDNIDITPFNIETQEDDGEDYSVNLNLSLNNSSENLIEHFFIQNKGKENITKLSSKQKNGIDYYQFSLKIRNAVRYYYHLQSPIFVTLADNSCNKIYWYAIQLDKEIETLIKYNKAKNRKSITISIPKENILNKSNSDRFIKELYQAKQIINNRTKNRIAKSQESKIKFETKYKEGSLVDNLVDYIKQFEGFHNIPYSLFKKNSPFTLNENSQTSFDLDTFYTDNIELIEFFEAIEVKQNKYSFKLPNKYSNEKEVSKKIKFIVNFLLSNNIQHLSIKNQFKRRVCIHKLLINKKCTCIKCLFNKGEINKVMPMFDIENRNGQEEFKKGYVLTLMHKYSDALILYKKLFDRLDNRKNPLTKILCCYNISRLIKLCDGMYGGQEIELIKENISKFDFDDYYIISDDILSQEQKYFLEHLTTNQFYNTADWEINEIRENVERNYLSDNFGGSSKNSNLDRLFIEWNRFFHFTNSNGIIYEVFHEFKLLKNKVVETLIGSHSIKNVESSKLEYFNDTFNSIFISTDSETLEYLFEKYDVDKIDFGGSSKKAIIDFKNKFDATFESYKLQFNNQRQFDWLYSNDLYKRFNTCLYLLGYIEIDIDWLNKKLLEIQDFAKNLDKRLHINIVKMVHKLLSNPLVPINDEVQKAWFEYALLHKDHYCYEIIYHYSSYLLQSKKNINLPLDISIKIFEMIENCKNSNCLSSNLVYYVGYFDLMKRNERTKFSTIIEKEIEKEFSVEIYYLCSLHNIINYSTNFSKYIESIPSCKQQKEHPAPFGYKFKNYRLNEFINLCYKFQIPFDRYQYLHSNVKYYEWLMNLKSFDYSNFNPYWLIYYDTVYYMNEFKKYKIIKEKLQDYILKHKVKGLINIYINNFVNEN